MAKNRDHTHNPTVATAHARPRHFRCTLGDPHAALAEGHETRLGANRLDVGARQLILLLAVKTRGDARQVANSVKEVVERK